MSKYREVGMDHLVVAAKRSAERGLVHVMNLHLEHPRILNEVDVRLAWLSVAA